MTKKFSVVLIFIYVILLFTSCSTYDYKIITTKRTIVNIAIDYSDFSKSCIGTAIRSDGLVLTTAHSFADTYDYSHILCYSYINSTKYVLKIISIDFHNDLALLQCDYEFMQVATYIENQISSGDKLYLATDGISTHSLYKSTVINADQIIEYDSYERTLISITTNASYGDSGAPLIDGKGNYIGILSAKLERDNNTFFAINSRTINKFLEGI